MTLAKTFALMGGTITANDNNAFESKRKTPRVRVPPIDRLSAVFVFGMRPAQASQALSVKSIGIRPEKPCRHCHCR